MDRWEHPKNPDRGALIMYHSAWDLDHWEGCYAATHVGLNGPPTFVGMFLKVLIGWSSSWLIVGHDGKVLVCHGEHSKIIVTAKQK